MFTPGDREIIFIVIIFRIDDFQVTLTELLLPLVFSRSSKAIRIAVVLQGSNLFLMGRASRSRRGKVITLVK